MPDSQIVPGEMVVTNLRAGQVVPVVAVSGGLSVNRRHFLTASIFAPLAGCGRGDAPDAPDRVWGRKGSKNGEFERPRAATACFGDKIAVVDYAARVQVFDEDGTFVGPGFQMPDFRNGRPSGLGQANDGTLIVADSHYHCLRFYAPDGELLKTFGGEVGRKPGQFGYLSDAIQMPDGSFRVAEFGLNERISVLDPNGKFVKCFGAAGESEGEFSRLRALALGKDGLIYAADACNHRIQVFDADGNFVRMWGRAGSGPGEMDYPYDVGAGPDGSVYVAEYGNQRLQKFSPAGRSLGVWGRPGGMKPGELAHPWGLTIDRKGRVHLLDTDHHRVQRVKL